MKSEQYVSSVINRINGLYMLKYSPPLFFCSTNPVTDRRSSLSFPISAIAYATIYTSDLGRDVFTYTLFRTFILSENIQSGP